MAISTEKLKFLDIINYIAPGYSYATFLKAYDARENKGYLCYDWFDSVDKLSYGSLPPYDAFYSKLKNMNVLNEHGEGEKTYKWLQEVWVKEGMETFEDFLRWYANRDTQPFVEAVENMRKFYVKNKIDLFKDSISVPGVARRLLFKSTDAKFPLFDYKTKDIFKTIERNITGGPSIVFTRLHEVDKTFIRDNREKPCKNIIGEDFNSLYTFSIDSSFGTGCFVDRKAKDQFKPVPSTKFMSMYFWMDYIAKRDNIIIKHRLNNDNKEVRIGVYPVDGYSEENGKTVYEFQGCYFHPHVGCALVHDTDDPKRQELMKKRMERTQFKRKCLEDLGYKVVSIQECEYKKDIESEIDEIQDQYLPTFYQENKSTLSEWWILKCIENESLFGLVECDIAVPDEWPRGKERDMSPKEYFSEMAPLFCTSDIPFEHFGSHMQEHVKKHGLPQKNRTLLVGGLSAKNILLTTPLLRWYITHGLVVSSIHRVIEFQPQRCFRDFVTNVCDARRAGDVDKSKEMIANTMKLLANSSYGCLCMCKSKHRQIVYVRGDALKIHVNDPRFRNVTPLDDDIFELEMSKRKITYDVPNYLAHFILNTAKLRVLSYYYDCLDYFVPRSCFELCQMDTDSLYFAISATNFIDVVKPELKDEYLARIYDSCHIDKFDADSKYWYPRQCCERHAKFDKRTPGLMKLEASGKKLTSLCSKTYLLTTNDDDFKMSSKGINKKRVQNPKDIFENVLKTQRDQSAKNIGFRAKDNTVFTYEQTRKGFPYLYVKREVLDDGIHTKPLSVVLNPLRNDNIMYVDAHSILSNYHECHIINDFTITVGTEKNFFSAHQLFMYAMAMFHDMDDIANEIKESTNPFHLKNKNIDIVTNEEWIHECNDKMRDVLLLKWLWSYEFREALDTTKTIVVCGWDRYWTCGLSLNVARVSKITEYGGQNVLGGLLMELRDYVSGLKAGEMLELLYDLREHERSECNTSDNDDDVVSDENVKPHTVRELCDVAKSLLLEM